MVRAVFLPPRRSGEADLSICPSTLFGGGGTDRCLATSSLSARTPAIWLIAPVNDPVARAFERFTFMSCRTPLKFSFKVTISPKMFPTILNPSLTKIPTDSRSITRSRTILPHTGIPTSAPSLPSGPVTRVEPLDIMRDINQFFIKNTSPIMIAGPPICLPDSFRTSRGGNARSRIITSRQMDSTASRKNTSHCRYGTPIPDSAETATRAQPKMTPWSRMIWS